MTSFSRAAQPALVAIAGKTAMGEFAEPITQTRIHALGVRGMYEKLWGHTLATVEALLEAGEWDLARVLSLLEGTTNPFDGYEATLQQLLEKSSLPRDGQNRTMVKPVARLGKYQLVPVGVFDRSWLAAALRYIGGDTDWVVELGSGWGRNLFEIYLQKKPTGLRFASCEITDAGRRAMECLIPLAEGAQMSTHRFDYSRPELRFLEGRPNVLFLTVHSVEAITFFNDDVYDLMLAKTGKCTCIHVEPVGWQREKSMTRTVRESLAKGLLPEKLLRLDNENFSENAAIWAWRHRYNVDLLEAVDRYQRAGKIEIRELEFDYFGANPFNPSSLIVWQKAP